MKKDYFNLSWKGFEKIMNKLIKQIPLEKFDSIMCVSSGGLVPGKLIADKSGLPLAVIAASAYEKGKTQVKKEVTLGGIASIHPIKGKILLVDDIVDTGKSMEKVYNFLIEKKEIINVASAVLYLKPGSCFQPDFYVDETKKWIVFPYMKNEFLRGLKK